MTWGFHLMDLLTVSISITNHTIPNTISGVIFTLPGMSMANNRHITSKFYITPYTFFATHNNKGGFKIQFSLCSVKIH